MEHCNRLHREVVESPPMEKFSTRLVAHLCSLLCTGVGLLKIEAFNSASSSVVPLLERLTQCSIPLNTFAYIYVLLPLNSLRTIKDSHIIISFVLPIITCTRCWNSCIILLMRSYGT